MSETAQTATSTPGGVSNAPVDNSARNRLVIGVLMISTFVVILNETIIGVAIPQFIIAFTIDASAAQWLSAAFMLTMAVVIPITGFLLQRFNTRPIFIAAMSFFSAGTAIAVLAPGFDVLLIARVVQACGTAIMFPLLITTVMELVPPATRGRTMGNISIVISVAPALGPSISGLILNTFDNQWRWLFILVLPIAIAALIVGGIRVKNVATPKKTKFDVPSVILSAFGFGGLVYGISNLGTATASTVTLAGWVPLGVGVVGIALFVLRQLPLQKRDSALLDLRTFKSRTFTFSIAMLVVSMMAFFGTIIVLPIYLETVLHLKVLNTGLLLLPGGLLMGFLAPFVGRFYDRYGPTALLTSTRRSGGSLSPTWLSALGLRYFSRPSSPLASARFPKTCTRTAARPSVPCSRLQARQGRPCSLRFCLPTRCIHPRLGRPPSRRPPSESTGRSSLRRSSRCSPSPPRSLFARR
jgi:DHA2 family lincomycin resistance protein-like MFS transporter